MAFVRSLFSWRSSCYMLLQALVCIFTFNCVTMTYHWSLEFTSSPKGWWWYCFGAIPELLTEVLTFGKWTLR